MPRLLIDARMVGHSGIGTYLAELLPRILPGVGEWRPVLFTGVPQREEVQRLAGGHARVQTWRVPPLSLVDLVSSPPGAAPGDVLWTPHFNVPLRGSLPLAVTLHDLLPLTVPDLAGHGRKWPVRAWLGAIRRRARTVLCVSEFTRAEALRHGRLQPSRVHVTKLGADPAWAAAGAANRAAAATPTMIFVGLLKPHKNALRLLRAFARVRDRIPHRLVMVARHRNVRNVDQGALDLAATLGDRVELVEDVPFAELVQRVASAQFAVQPSLHEGFGLPALEAMAAGVPVLAGRAGALPEVCGDAAVYCNPESEDEIARSLLLLANDATLRARLTAAGRARAQQFSWDACAQATQAALDAAMRGA
jgi:glycosyltransferase involved in cell wall biosynthesis